MPVRARKIRDTGATILEHLCEDCGEDANFGIGVSLRQALNEAARGKMDLARELLGKWYCLEHWREREKEVG